VDPRDWLEIVQREYLDGFIRDGGAAVKFAVPTGEEHRHALQEGLRAMAETNGFQFAFVDAQSTKIHLIEQLFHSTARQIDWDALTRAFLARSLAEMGFRVPGSGEDLTVSTLAALNDYEEPLFLTEVSRRLYQRLMRDYAMTREFRLAMFRLCLAQLDPGEDPTLKDALEQWLVGELRLISGLKRALIFQKIARHNARHLLFSLSYWLKACGKSGLVLALDITRYLDASRPSERGSGFYYSTAALLDAYEVLRQLIDATDEMAFCFVGVLAGPEFLTDDRRGLRRYHALYLRVSDEVRDRYRPNPLSALVRLSSAPLPAPSGHQPLPASDGSDHAEPGISQPNLVAEPPETEDRAMRHEGQEVWKR
jgi:hypothetical protein